MNRREFLKRSTIAAGIAKSLTGCAPQATRVRDHKPLGANDRIRLGIIGCGGLGQDHHIPTLMRMSQDPKYNIQLAAVCDVYEPRKKLAHEKSGGAEVFHDYRKMLDRDDIHGVVVVTPDHWHARMTLDAMEAGKDVHVEKPMTLYWEEAKQVHETAQRLKRVVQVGAEGTSSDVWWQARKAIAEGKLGKVVWVSGGVYRNAREGDWNTPISPECTPATLDWEAWLGPAPKRPFDPERFFRYRKYWDYSGGVAHDLIAHTLSALQVGVGPEFPTKVTAVGGLYCTQDRETPDTFSMMLEYPSQYMATLFCTQTTEVGVETAIRGNKASIRFQRIGEKRTAVLVPEGAYAKDTQPVELPREPRQNHDENFIDCMRTRKPPHCDTLTGYKVMVALGLAVRSYREGKTFKFDPSRQEIVAC